MATKEYELVTCTKCNGRGIMHEFAATYDGVCFKCNGNKVVRVRKYTEAELAAKEARKAKRDAVAAEAIRAEHALHTEQAAEAAAAAAVQKAAFQHLPAAAGDAVQLTGKVQYMKVVESQYGSSLLVVLRTDYEHEVKTFTTAQWAWDATAGDVVTLKATVKDLSEYEGKKSTAITRAKLVA